MNAQFTFFSGAVGIYWINSSYRLNAPPVLLYHLNNLSLQISFLIVKSSGQVNNNNQLNDLPMHDLLDRMQKY